MVALLTFGPVQVLVPKLLGTVLALDEQKRGILMAALGGGLFTGGVLAAFFDRSRRRASVIVVATLAGVVAVMALGVLDTRLAVGVTLGAVGIAGGMVTSLVPAALQSATPDHMKGRVMSLFTISFQTTPAIAAGVSGWVADAQGVGVSLTLTGAVVGVLAVGVVSVVPGVREWALAGDDGCQQLSEEALAGGAGQPSGRGGSA